jgi:hypothetical protein
MFVSCAGVITTKVDLLYRTNLLDHSPKPGKLGRQSIHILSGVEENMNDLTNVMRELATAHVLVDC